MPLDPAAQNMSDQHTEALLHENAIPWTLVETTTRAAADTETHRLLGLTTRRGSQGGHHPFEPACDLPCACGPVAVE